MVVAETYPAEACIHLGLSPPGYKWSKTKQKDRQGQSGRLFEWADEGSITFDENLDALIQDGFGTDKGAEDLFDAVLGALSMIEVILGRRIEGNPQDISVRQIEGWIFGQEA